MEDMTLFELLEHPLASCDGGHDAEHEFVALAFGDTGVLLGTTDILTLCGVVAHVGPPTMA